MRTVRRPYLLVDRLVHRETVHHRLHLQVSDVRIPRQCFSSSLVRVHHMRVRLADSEVVRVHPRVRAYVCVSVLRVSLRLRVGNAPRQEPAALVLALAVVPRFVGRVWLREGVRDQMGERMGERVVMVRVGKRGCVVTSVVELDIPFLQGRGKDERERERRTTVGGQKHERGGHRAPAYA